IAVTKKLIFKMFPKKGREGSNEMVPEHLDLQDPLSNVLANERASEVRSAIAKLSPSLREVVILRWYEELPLADVAEIVKESEGNVKVRLHRAKEQLREHLGSYFKVSN